MCVKIYFKKIDQVILKTFIGPFIAVFLVTVLALTLQIIWLYLDDFVGKGADFITIVEALLFMAASMVPLALPLAVLIASIMTYGHLAETLELVILRASGISSIRIMAPIGISALLLCGLAFMFNNYFIPKAELKKNRLMFEIISSKPAFDLQPGKFYDKIDGYVLKIGSKHKNNQDIYDIIIYENEGNSINNIILAKHGKMELPPKTNSLLFLLYDGSYYQRLGTDQGGDENTFSRTHFDEYRKEFQLWSFLKSSDKDFSNNKRLFSVQQLDKYIDSIEKQMNVASEQTKRIFFNSTYNVIDSLSSNNKFPTTSTTTYLQLIPDSLHNNMIMQARNNASALLSNFVFEEQKNMYNTIIGSQIEWHKKISLSVACFVFFLIGAPLGSIIKKGGIGMPIVVAIVSFIIFFFVNTYGERLASTKLIPPLQGIWLGIGLFFIIGLFLTYQSLSGLNIMSKDLYINIYKKTKKLFTLKSKKS